MCVRKKEICLTLHGRVFKLPYKAHALSSVQCRFTLLVRIWSETRCFLLLFQACWNAYQSILFPACFPISKYCPCLSNLQPNPSLAFRLPNKCSCYSPWVPNVDATRRTGYHCRIVGQDISSNPWLFTEEQDPI